MRCSSSFKTEVVYSFIDKIKIIQRIDSMKIIQSVNVQCINTVTSLLDSPLNALGLNIARHRNNGGIRFPHCHLFDVYVSLLLCCQIYLPTLVL